MNDFGHKSFDDEFFAQKWEILDGQIYLYSYNYFRLISQHHSYSDDIEQLMRRQARRLRIELPPQNPAILADRWAQELDRFGISRACLVADSVGDEYSVSESIRTNPSKFLGLIQANPQLSVIEDIIEDAVRDGQAKGIFLHPAWHRFSAGAEFVYPLYQLARQLRLVVYVDYGSSHSSLKYRWAPHFWEFKYNNPKQLHFAAADFPTVPFVISRCTDDNFHDILHLGLLSPNVHVIVSPDDAFLSDNDGLHNFRERVELLVRAFGYQRLIFGTMSGELPRGWRSDRFRVFLNTMRELGLEDSQMSLIMGGNLRRIFRLDQDQAPPQSPLM